MKDKMSFRNSTEERIQRAKEKLNVQEKYLRKDGYFFVEAVLNNDTGKIGEKAFCQSYDNIPRFNESVNYYKRNRGELVIEYRRNGDIRLYPNCFEDLKNVLITEKNIDKFEENFEHEDCIFSTTRIIEHIMMYDNESEIWESIESFCSDTSSSYDYPFCDGYYCNTRMILTEKLFNFLLKYERFNSFELVVKNYGLKIIGQISYWLYCFGKFYDLMGFLFLEESNFLPKIFAGFLHGNDNKFREKILDKYFDESLEKFIENFFQYYLLVTKKNKINLFRFVDSLKKSDFDLFFKDFIDNLILLDDDDKIFDVIQKFEEAEKIGNDIIRLY